MAKRKRINFTSPTGIAVFPRIKSPDTKFDAGGVFQTKLSVPAEEAADFIAEMEKIRDDFLAQQLEEANPQVKAKIKKYTIADVAEPEVDDEGDETGNVILKFKLNHTVERKDGTTFTQRPSVFDAAGNQLKRVPNVGGGSQLVIGGTVVPYAMAATKTVGVSLRMEGVQILDLVEFGGGRSAEGFGFGKHDDGFVVDDSLDDADVDEDCEADNDGDDDDDEF